MEIPKSMYPGPCRTCPHVRKRAGAWWCMHHVQARLLQWGIICNQRFHVKLVSVHCADEEQTV